MKFLKSKNIFESEKLIKLEISNEDLIEMLENINEILIPYRDTNDFSLSIFDFNSNELVKIHGDVRECLENIENIYYLYWRFLIINITPWTSKVEMDYVGLKSDTEEILERLNQEYGNIFDVGNFVNQIFSQPIKIIN